MFWLSFEQESMFISNVLLSRRIWCSLKLLSSICDDYRGSFREEGWCSFQKDVYGIWSQFGCSFEGFDAHSRMIWIWFLKHGCYVLLNQSSNQTAFFFLSDIILNPTITIFNVHLHFHSIHPWLSGILPVCMSPRSGRIVKKFNFWRFAQRRVGNVFLSGSRNDGSRYGVTSRRV